MKDVLKFTINEEICRKIVNMSIKQPKHKNAGNLNHSNLKNQPLKRNSQLLTEYISFIHDFSLYQLLYDIFQRYESYRLVEGIALALVVDPVDEGHVALVALLEYLEHDVQGDVLEHEIAGVLVELAERFQGSIVVRVDECEIFYVQHCHNVLSRAFVHGDS